MKIQRRTFLTAGLTGMVLMATQGIAATLNAPTRFAFHVSGVAGGPVDGALEKAYAPFIAELESRGFPSMRMHSSVQGSAEDQIRPEWEQSAAREVLGVEPVVIPGAGHADIYTAPYVHQLAGAFTEGLR